MPQLDGSILTPIGWRRGRLGFGSRILAVQGEAVAEPTPPFIVAGFIDLHVHGGGGADVMQGTEAVRQMARTHARHGTTALLATTLTAPFPVIEAALDGVAAVAARPGGGEARVLGAHLEGPFLNRDKLGAQPDHAVAPDLAALTAWAARAPVRVMTFAPELDRAGRLHAALREHGIRAQIGHSLATADIAAAALRDGAGVTHLYNAMSGLDHRAPGVVGAALALASHAEIICDLVHVEPLAMRAALRAIPGLYGITDATSGAGMPDGDYPLGDHTAQKRDGVMRLADGTLAGSSLTMNHALGNLVGLGLPLDEAVARLTAVPASWLGLDDRGRLVEGAFADLVVLDRSLDVIDVYVEGQRVGGV